MRAYTERKYYKWQYGTWVQPTLISDGVFGGNEMAVAFANSRCNYLNGTPYTIFNPNTEKAAFYCNEYKGWVKVQIYYPKEVKITSISFDIYTSGTATSSAYNTKLYRGGIEIASLGTIMGAFSSNIQNNEYSRYYILYMENGGYANEDLLTFGNISLSGQYRDAIESNKSDYDFYINPNFKIIEQQDKYYAINSYEKGQYYGN